MEEQQDVLRSRACEVHLGQDAKSLLTVDWVPDKETNLVNSLPVVGEEGCVGLIHVWAPPADWDEHFPHLPYAEAKQREMQRAFGDKECMVTCDVTCLSAPLSEADHPLEQVHWGPILFTTKEVKARIRSPYDTTDSSEAAEAPLDTNLAFLRFSRPHHFSDQLKLRETDIFGNPKINPTKQPVEWTLAPGRYTILKAEVADQHRVNCEEFQPYVPCPGMPFTSWMARYCLPDKTWLEITLGSARCEALKVWEAIIWKQRSLCAVVPWNFFKRLWCMYEWAQFLGPGGGSLNDIRIYWDWFTIPQVLPLYERMITFVSVNDAEVTDPRDLDFLKRKIESYWRCPSTESFYYDLPEPRKPRPPPKTPGQVDKVYSRTVDFSAFERFIRVTAIAIFAKTFMLTKCSDRKSSEYWYLCWEEIAERLKYKKLHRALKSVKPYSWVHETDFDERVQDWFDTLVIPVIEEERMMAMRARA